MLAEEPDVRKALVRFREGRGGNLRGAPRLLDLRLVSRQLAAAAEEVIFSHLVSNGFMFTAVAKRKNKP